MNSLKIITCRASTNLEMGKAKNTNFYEVLRLESENVGFNEIKKAYRSMALQYHPDVCPPLKKDEYTKKFVDLHRAYETLSDPVLRREHDLELRMCELGVNEPNRFSVQSEFSRERWEVQLHELMRRSERRAREKSEI